MNLLQHFLGHLLLSLDKFCLFLHVFSDLVENYAFRSLATLSQFVQGLIELVKVTWLVQLDVGLTTLADEILELVESVITLFYLRSVR